MKSKIKHFFIYHHYTKMSMSEVSEKVGYFFFLACQKSCERAKLSLFVLFFIKTFPRAFHSFHLSLLSRNVVDHTDNTESKVPQTPKHRVSPLVSRYHMHQISLLFSRKQRAFKEQYSWSMTNVGIREMPRFLPITNSQNNQAFPIGDSELK